MAKRFRALGRNLWVKPILAKEVTKSGIWLPKAQERDQLMGVVLSVGPDVRRSGGDLDRAATLAEAIGGEGSVVADALLALKDSNGINVGDTICYGKYGGQHFDVAGVGDTIMISETEVFAVIYEVEDSPSNGEEVATADEHWSSPATKN